jgi:boron transporter
MAQSSDFPLRKPPGFHWDFFLLGVTTFLAGLLGLPAPNGLIPQAPIHTTSLLVLAQSSKKTDDEEKIESDLQPKGVSSSCLGSKCGVHRPESNRGSSDSQAIVEQDVEVPVGVVEQRVSNLAQGSLCLVLLTGPFLHALHLIPRGVL